MHLRIRLILAFLLLSVVPLGAVTVYSYISNTEALQVAATREADYLATELSQRMQLVTAQLSQRVEHLMDIPQQPVTVVRTSSTQVVPTAPTAPPAPAAPAAPVVAETSGLDTQVADALGEAAMLLNTVEYADCVHLAAGAGAAVQGGQVVDLAGKVGRVGGLQAAVAFPQTLTASVEVGVVQAAPDDFHPTRSVGRTLTPRPWPPRPRLPSLRRPRRPGQSARPRLRPQPRS